MPLAVATCGTALTDDEHVRLLRASPARRLVLAFDADAAGQAAALSALPVGGASTTCRWPSPTCRRARTRPTWPGPAPTGSRPRSTAPPFLRFRLDQAFAAADLASNEGQARAAERALEIVAEHPTDLVRDQYLMDVASRCRVEPDRLRTLLDHVRRRPARRHPDEAAAAARVCGLASRPVRAGRGVTTVPPAATGRRGPGPLTGAPWSRATPAGGWSRTGPTAPADGSGPAPADRETSGGDRSAPVGVASRSRRVTARRSRCCGTPCTTPAPSPGGWARSCSTIPSGGAYQALLAADTHAGTLASAGAPVADLLARLLVTEPESQASTPCACCTWRWPGERSPRCDWVRPTPTAPAR